MREPYINFAFLHTNCSYIMESRVSNVAYLSTIEYEEDPFKYYRFEHKRQESYAPGTGDQYELGPHSVHMVSTTDNQYSQWQLPRPSYQFMIKPEL